MRAQLQIFFATFFMNSFKNFYSCISSRSRSTSFAYPTACHAAGATDAGRKIPAASAGLYGRRRIPSAVLPPCAAKVPLLPRGKGRFPSAPPPCRTPAAPGRFCKQWATCCHLCSGTKNILHPAARATADKPRCFPAATVRPPPEPSLAKRAPAAAASANPALFPLHALEARPS